MANETPLSRIDLFLKAGPLKGKRIALAMGVPLDIGRSKRGVHLVDPTVSIEHAEIVWEDDSYWIVDLRSRTGTFVDGTPIGSTPIRLRPGMEVVIGDSKFFVERRVNRPSWSVPTIALSLFALVGTGVYWTVTNRPVIYEPALTAETAVTLYDGSRVNEVPIPIEFVRASGMDERGLTIREVSDYNEDGISEVWFHGPSQTKQWVVTFDENNEWVELGEMPWHPPQYCREKETDGMPILECNTETYQFDSGLNKYMLVAQEGAVVWMHPMSGKTGSVAVNSDKDAGSADKDSEDQDENKPKVKKKKPGRTILPELKPYAFSVSHEEQLAEFFRQRGIDEQVHYIVCEGALTKYGVAAQALTASGALVPLSKGCLDLFTINGLSGKLNEKIDLRPQIVAFTANGRRAFIRDLQATVTGGSEGEFISAKKSQLMAQISRVPDQIGGGALRVLVDAGGRDGTAIAPDSPIEGLRQLVLFDEKKPAAQTARYPIPDHGIYEVEAANGHQLVVTVENFLCARSKWCMPTNRFITVTEVSAGKNVEILSAPYESGRFTRTLDGIEVQVGIDGTEGASRFDVQRAWLAYRIE